MAQLVCSLNNSKNTRLCFGSTYREVKIILGTIPHIYHFSPHIKFLVSPSKRARIATKQILCLRGVFLEETGTCRREVLAPKDRISPCTPQLSNWEPWHRCQRAMGWSNRKPAHQNLDKIIWKMLMRKGIVHFSSATRRMSTLLSQLPKAGWPYASFSASFTFKEMI